MRLFVFFENKKYLTTSLFSYLFDNACILTVSKNDYMKSVLDTNGFAALLPLLTHTQKKKKILLADCSICGRFQGIHGTSLKDVDGKCAKDEKVNFRRYFQPCKKMSCHISINSRITVSAFS